MNLLIFRIILLFFNFFNILSILTHSDKKIVFIFHYLVFSLQINHSTVSFLTKIRKIHIEKYGFRKRPTVGQIENILWRYL
jgi:hypothetical protein